MIRSRGLAALLALTAAVAACGSDGGGEDRPGDEAAVSASASASTSASAAEPSADMDGGRPLSDATPSTTSSTTPSTTLPEPRSEEAGSQPADEQDSVDEQVTAGEPAAEGDGAAEEAVETAYLTVFDSEVPFDEKLPYLEDAEQLRSTFESFADTAEGFGGISLEPTSVVIDGAEAEVTYDVLFGGSAAYSDMSGDAVLRDGVWMVTRARFCAFMSSARVSCPSG